MTDHEYVVSKGAWSDYSVMCVCPDRATAERVASAYNSDPETYSEARVETLPVVTEPRKVTSYQVQVTIFDNGDVRDGVCIDQPWTEQLTERSDWEFDALDPEKIRRVWWRWVRAPMHNGEAGRLEVGGTDRETVLKVFSERKAHLLADDAMRRRRRLKG